MDALGPEPEAIRLAHVGLPGIHGEPVSMTLGQEEEKGITYRWTKLRFRQSKQIPCRGEASAGIEASGMGEVDHAGATMRRPTAKSGRALRHGGHAVPVCGDGWD